MVSNVGDVIFNEEIPKPPTPHPDTTSEAIVPAVVVSIIALATIIVVVVLLIKRRRLMRLNADLSAKSFDRKAAV